MAKKRNKIKELRKGVSNIFSSMEEKCNALLALAEDSEDEELYNLVEEVTNKINDILMSDGDFVGQGAQEIIEYIDGDMTEYYRDSEDDYSEDY